MTANSKAIARSKDYSWPLRRVAGVVVATIAALAASGTTKADSQQYSVVARVDAKSARLSSGEVVVTIGNIAAPAITIKANPDIPRNIAIVLDAGPDQAKVLSKEKDLAVGLINDLAGNGTSFTIAEAGTSIKMQAPTQDRAIAIEQVRDITGNSGKRTNVAIYDAIGSVMRQGSVGEGLRIVVFIGEGNDGGSKLSYTALRDLAESHQVAFFAALIADHSLRGTKSILRYGWKLQDLAGDAAGIFLENQKTRKATRCVSNGVEGLRLIVFETPSRPSGRYKVSVTSRPAKRLLTQKAIFIP